MPTDVRSQGRALLPAPDPSRTKESEPSGMIQVFPDSSTSQPHISPGAPVAMGDLWNARWKQWRDNFEKNISKNAERYWGLWRNFARGPNPGPGMEWRDRTVIPQAFKELSTRIPRIVLGMWGGPGPYTVQGRGFKDTTYEETVRVLIQESLDEIGLNDPMGESFMKKEIDGETYCQVVGHVWWKMSWRHETHWLKTKIRDEEGEWTPVERLHVLYDNVDMDWLPISQLAVDLYGRRRWAIERVDTTLAALRLENENYKRENDEDLYDGLELVEFESMAVGHDNDNVREPEDYEHWPMQSGPYNSSPGEIPVELWLCWDNVKKTLTKIANRKIVIAHGLADTPDGLDPYIGEPAIPVPGRAYGDSILNWTAGLHIQQTRISRAIMDETLMNLFQQYLMREGSLGSTQMYWRPGGISTIGGSNANPDKPISDSIYLVPRRPMPPEAFRQRSYLQQESEATAGADAVSQGVEATSKSRDVSAAEINQRSLQGASRFQLEVLYKECVAKRPKLQKVFDLLQQNLTQPKLVRILEDTEGEMVDLTQLQRPVDIIIGGSLLEATQAEKMQELEKITNLAKIEGFAMVMKYREIFEDYIKGSRTLRRTASRYVKTEEEMKREQAQQAVMAIQAAQTAAPDAASPAPLALPPGAEGPGQPGAAGLADAGGSGAESLAVPAGGSVEEI